MDARRRTDPFARRQELLPGTGLGHHDVEPTRLGRLSFFQGLLYPELVTCAKVARAVEFAPGEELTRQGERGHSLWFVDSGGADVLIDGAKVAEVGPGEVVGEIAVLSDGRRTATVVATTPVVAAELLEQDIAVLDARAPEAAARLRAAMRRHIDRAAPSGSGPAAPAAPPAPGAPPA